MSKYSNKIVNKIIELISSDSYTIAEVCKIVGIAERTYYDWIEKNAEFAEAIKKAKEVLIHDTLVECDKSLKKLIKGYTVDETKTIYIDSKEGRPKIKEQTVTKKHYQPNLGAIIHFQTNHAPDIWKNRQNVDITTKGKEFTPARVLTKEEAKDLLKSLDNEY